MTGAFGVWAHNQAAPHVRGQADTPNTPTAQDPNDSDSDAGVISANDFLTLLVTEMQNQDPTADTDPNEYINQLVQVNSLEQLVSINQTVSAAFGTATSSGGDGNAVSKNPASPGAAADAAHTAAATRAARAPGNLTVPASNPAAQRVGHALGGIHARHL